VRNLIPAIKDFRSRLVKEPGRYADAAGVGVILSLTAVAGWDLFVGGTVVGMDAATQFYPWYSFLGESLRSFDIPGWNPHQLSGTPFAADPLSGWAYLPAMVLFTLLPLEPAAGAYLSVHLLLAGLFTYALARALGMNVAGALLAGVAYEYAGLLYVRNTCCFAYVGVVVWLPLAILGAEMAIRSPRWLGRILWCGLSGLGISQVLATWIGQGSYYALLALGGYVAYRALVFPPENVRGVGSRLLALLFVGGMVLVFGFGLAAAGVLPRLEYNGLSNLAGGYSFILADPADGFFAEEWLQLLKPGAWYAGAAVLALALAAPFLCRTRFAVPYFALLSLCALTLSGGGRTLLHSALYLLPGFDRLHPNAPIRVLVVFYLGAALLAGASLTSLAERSRRPAFLALMPVLAALFLITRVPSTTPEEVAVEVIRSDGWASRSPDLIEAGLYIPPAPMIALVLVLALAAACALLPDRFVPWRRLAALLLVLVVFVDMFASGSATLSYHIPMPGAAGRIQRMDLSEYYATTGSARFLRSAGEEPVRYFGYAPGLRRDDRPISSPYRFADPILPELGANNRAMTEGLQSVQGYDAVHLALYDEYMLELNGRSQNYHYADVLKERPEAPRTGPNSPLLDLLGARYVIVPAETREDQEALRDLEEGLPTVYEDEQVNVLERSGALPRAWIVHSAQRATPEEALDLLSSGGVDPRETALLENPSANLDQPDDPSADRASITEYEADRIELNTTTGAPGLLMLGEVYYPAWKAYVDGEPAPLYRADHLFRAVPVPAGEHTVELRYESRSLLAGTAISLLTVLILLALTAARLWGKRLVELRLPDKLRKVENGEQEPKGENSEK
jgi:hypothetical protein